MMAQALIFFFAGFDTLSTTLSILVHHLATYPDVQNKLCEEIDDVLEKYKNKITYDILMKEMVYMDLVIKGKLIFNYLITKISILINKLLI